MEENFGSNSTDDVSNNIFVNSEGLILDKSRSALSAETIALVADCSDEDTTHESLYVKTLGASEELESIKNFFHIQLISSFKNDESDDIFEYEPFILFEEYYLKYEVNALEWLNDLLIHNISKKFIVIGVLKILYRMDYEWCKSFGTAMLMMVIFYNNERPNTEITDLIIQTIENWKAVNFKPILEQLPIKVNYLEHYRNKVLTLLS